MDLDDLEIVGYAEVLNERLVPHVVPPIYRRRDDRGKLLFPPFRLAGDVVVGGMAGTREDLSHFIADGRATDIDPPIRAQADHELWIDQGMRPRYEPFDAADGHLREIATGALNRARQLLIKKDLAGAEREADMAMAADDRLADPFALKAAVAKLRGRDDDVESLRQIATVDCTPAAFDALLADLLKVTRPPASPKAAGRCFGLGVKPPIAMPLAPWAEAA